MIGQKVNLAHLELIYPGNVNNQTLISPKSLFKMIVYIDSTQCTKCEVSRLIIWNEFYDWFIQNNIPVYFVFNMNYNYELYMDLKRSELNYPAFIDNGHHLKKSFHLSENNLLHTFFTKNDTIIVVGTPIVKRKLFLLYKMELESCNTQKWSLRSISRIGFWLPLSNWHWLTFIYFYGL